MKIPEANSMKTNYANTGNQDLKKTQEESVQLALKTGEKKKTPQKRVRYNYREVSSALRQASKAAGAGQVLTKANLKLNGLLRCRASGEYDSKELEIAISHAKKIMQCAKVKINHLKLEEQKEHQTRRENNVDTSKTNLEEAERQRKLQQQQEEHKRAMEQNLLLQRIKTREREHNQKIQSHRRKENKDMDEADLKYLKEMTNGGYYLQGGSEVNELLGVLYESAISNQPVISEAALISEPITVVENAPIETGAAIEVPVVTIDIVI